MKAIAMLVGIAVVCGSASWLNAAEVRRITPGDRPYIVEIGSPKVIDRDRLDDEMALNPDLCEQVNFYGYPDVAEIQRVAPDWPWADYEVRLFYLDSNQKMAFGRTFIAPSLNYGLEKYKGPMSPSERSRIASLAKPHPGGDVYARAANAAERAAQAAERAATQSEAAAKAAERSEAVANKMESSFKQQLRK